MEVGRRKCILEGRGGTRDQVSESLSDRADPRRFWAQTLGQSPQPAEPGPRVIPEQEQKEEVV